MYPNSILEQLRARPELNVEAILDAMKAEGMPVYDIFWRMKIDRDGDYVANVYVAIREPGPEEPTYVAFSFLDDAEKAFEKLDRAIRTSMFNYPPAEEARYVMTSYLERNTIEKASAQGYYF